MHVSASEGRHTARSPAAAPYPPRFVHPTPPACPQFPGYRTIQVKSGKAYIRKTKVPEGQGAGPAAVQS